MDSRVRASAGGGRLHYAWVVAAITFLSLLATAGIGATRAVLVLPLEREFGWDRATISLALSINLAAVRTVWAVRGRNHGPLRRPTSHAHRTLHPGRRGQLERVHAVR